MGNGASTSQEVSHVGLHNSTDVTTESLSSNSDAYRNVVFLRATNKDGTEISSREEFLKLTPAAPYLKDPIIQDIGLNIIRDIFQKFKAKELKAFLPGTDVLKQAEKRVYKTGLLKVADDSDLLSILNKAIEENNYDIKVDVNIQSIENLRFSWDYNQSIDDLQKKCLACESRSLFFRPEDFQFEFKKGRLILNIKLDPSCDSTSPWALPTIKAVKQFLNIAAALAIAEQANAKDGTPYTFQKHTAKKILKDSLNAIIEDPWKILDNIALKRLIELSKDKKCVYLLSVISPQEVVRILDARNYEAEFKKFLERPDGKKLSELYDKSRKLLENDTLSPELFELIHKEISDKISKHHSCSKLGKVEKEIAVLDTILKLAE